MSVLKRRVEKPPATFRFPATISPGRLLPAVTIVEHRKAVPAYLRENVYDAIRTRTKRVEVHHASLVDFLKTQNPASLHRYVLLDAQDWMTADVLTALWREIDRTADTQDAKSHLSHRGGRFFPVAQTAPGTAGAVAIS